MNANTCRNGAASDRAAALYEESQANLHRRADRLFAALMVLQWLGGIIEHFRATDATIVLFRMPTRPLPLQASVPANGETFVQRAKKNRHVAVLDENLFADLATPSLFFDAYHLNDKGRAAFTPRLARAVIDKVDETRKANP